VSQRVNNLAIARRYVLRCGPLLAGSCVIYAFSGSTGAAWSAVLLLIGATAVQTIGEMVQVAGTWEISYGLVPAGRFGEYQAFFGSGLTVAELVGPLVLTSMLVYWGSPGWLLLGGLFIAAATSMAPVMSWAERRLPARQLATEPA
jgi:MFS family permease